MPALTRPAKRTGALLTKLLALQLRALNVPGVPDFNFSEHQLTQRRRARNDKLGAMAVKCGNHLMNYQVKHF